MIQGPRPFPSCSSTMPKGNMISAFREEGKHEAGMPFTPGSVILTISYPQWLKNCHVEPLRLWCSPQLGAQIYDGPASCLATAEEQGGSEALPLPTPFQQAEFFPWLSFWPDHLENRNTLSCMSWPQISPKCKISYKFLFFNWLCHEGHMRSQFPNQESMPAISMPLHWKHSISTTGPSRKFEMGTFISMILQLCDRLKKSMGVAADMMFSFP